MLDYEKMYRILFVEMHDTIDRFKARLLEVEEIFISEKEIVIALYEDKSEKGFGVDS